MKYDLTKFELSIVITRIIKTVFLCFRSRNFANEMGSSM